MSKSSIDRLFDLINGEPQWTRWTWSEPTKIDNAIEELRIIPDTPNGPTLEMVTKNGSGTELFKQRFNLAAVDDLIGRLIKHRDLMAQAKEPPNGPTNP